MNPTPYADPLDQLLDLQRQGRQITYLPNPGNRGDALIVAATIQRFEALGIRYVVRGTPFQHDPRNVYVYGGGGNLVPAYDDCKGALRAFATVRADVVVLPQSCHGVESEIRAYPGGLTIWARERASHDFLAKINSDRLQIGLQDDLSLALNLNDPRFYYLGLARQLHSSTPEHPPRVLSAFRRDLESTGTHSIPGAPTNFDVSDMGFSGLGSSRGFGLDHLAVDTVFNHAAWFLSFIDYFDVIHTDRLHVGIAAALLAKDVRLHDNIYGKVREVYEYSLKHRPGFRITPMW